MNFVQMKCPNCNADLSVDDGLESFFCQYCGTKILLAGQSDSAIKAKSRIKMMDKAKEMQQEYHSYKAAEKKRREEEQRKLLPLAIGLMLAALVLIGAMAYFTGIAPERKERERLEAVYTEIQQDISNGDYDSALVKANSLHWSLSGRDETKRWDKTREGLIEIIEDLREKN